GFLRPLDQTILPAGPVSVVARTVGKTELRLDGKVVGASQPAPDVLTTTLNPAPGRHELAAGNQRIQFFVGAAASAPRGGGEFKIHPPAATCATCHAVHAGVRA